MNASEDVTQSVVCSSSLHHVVEVHLSKIKNKKLMWLKLT